MKTFNYFISTLNLSHLCIVSSESECLSLFRLQRALLLALFVCLFSLPLCSILKLVQLVERLNSTIFSYLRAGLVTLSIHVWKYV